MFMLQRMHALNTLIGGSLPLAFVASDTGRGSGGTLTINKPTGTQAGDILVAVVANAAFATSISSAPSGWSSWVTNSGQFIYYKVAGGSEPASYDWAWASGNTAGCIVTYRSGNVGVAGTGASDSTALSITPNATGTLLAFYCILNNTTVSSPPGGMTLRASNLGLGLSIVVYDQENVGASATGNKALTWSAAGNQRSVLTHLEQA